VHPSLPPQPHSARISHSSSVSAPTRDAREQQRGRSNVNAPLSARSTLTDSSGEMPRTAASSSSSTSGQHAPVAAASVGGLHLDFHMASTDLSDSGAGTGRLSSTSPAAAEASPSGDEAALDGSGDALEFDTLNSIESPRHGEIAAQPPLPMHHYPPPHAATSSAFPRSYMHPPIQPHTHSQPFHHPHARSEFSHAGMRQQEYAPNMMSMAALPPSTAASSVMRGRSLSTLPHQAFGTMNEIVGYSHSDTDRSFILSHLDSLRSLVESYRHHSDRTLKSSKHELHVATRSLIDQLNAQLSEVESRLDARYANAQSLALEHALELRRKVKREVRDLRERVSEWIREERSRIDQLQAERRMTERETAWIQATAQAAAAAGGHQAALSTLASAANPYPSLLPGGIPTLSNPSSSSSTPPSGSTLLPPPFDRSVSPATAASSVSHHDLISLRSSIEHLTTALADAATKKSVQTQLDELRAEMKSLAQSHNASNTITTSAHSNLAAALAPSSGRDRSDSASAATRGDLHHLQSLFHRLEHSFKEQQVEFTALQQSHAKHMELVAQGTERVAFNSEKREREAREREARAEERRNNLEQTCERLTKQLAQMNEDMANMKTQMQQRQQLQSSAQGQTSMTMPHPIASSSLTQPPSSPPSPSSFATRLSHVEAALSSLSSAVDQNQSSLGQRFELLNQSLEDRAADIHSRLELCEQTLSNLLKKHRSNEAHVEAVQEEMVALVETMKDIDDRLTAKANEQMNTVNALQNDLSELRYSFDSFQAFCYQDLQLKYAALKKLEQIVEEKIAPSSTPSIIPSTDNVPMAALSVPPSHIRRVPSVERDDASDNGDDGGGEEEEYDADFIEESPDTNGIGAPTVIRSEDTSPSLTSQSTLKDEVASPKYTSQFSTLPSAAPAHDLGTGTGTPTATTPTAPSSSAPFASSAALSTSTSTTASASTASSTLLPTQPPSSSAASSSASFFDSAADAARAPPSRPRFKPSNLASCNTAEEFATIRRELRAYGIRKFMDDMIEDGSFVKGADQLPMESRDEEFEKHAGASDVSIGRRGTSFIPFRQRVSESPLRFGEPLISLGLSANIAGRFIVGKNSRELDKAWASEDPLAVGKVSMGERHRCLRIRSLHWSTFNVVTMGMTAVDDDDGKPKRDHQIGALTASLRLLSTLSTLAHLYTRRSGWSSDLGLFVRCYPFNSFDALHLHMVDLQRTGPTFHALQYKNLPLEAVRKTLESELEDLLGSEETQRLLKTIEEEVQKQFRQDDEVNKDGTVQPQVSSQKQSEQGVEKQLPISTSDLTRSPPIPCHLSLRCSCRELPEELIGMQCTVLVSVQLPSSSSPMFKFTANGDLEEQGWKRCGWTDSREIVEDENGTGGCVDFDDAMTIPCRIQDDDKADLAQAQAQAQDQDQDQALRLELFVVSSSHSSAVHSVTQPIASVYILTKELVKEARQRKDRLDELDEERSEAEELEDVVTSSAKDDNTCMYPLLGFDAFDMGVERTPTLIVRPSIPDEAVAHSIDEEPSTPDILRAARETESQKSLHSISAQSGTLPTPHPQLSAPSSPTSPAHVRLLLLLRVNNIPLDASGHNRPLLALFAQDQHDQTESARTPVITTAPTRFTFVGQTEWVKDVSSVEFEQPILCDYTPANILRFNLYDAHRGKESEHEDQDEKSDGVIDEEHRVASVFVRVDDLYKAACDSARAAEEAAQHGDSADTDWDGMVRELTFYFQHEDTKQQTLQPIELVIEPHLHSDDVEDDETQPPEEDDHDKEQEALVSIPVDNSAIPSPSVGVVAAAQPSDTSLSHEVCLRFSCRNLPTSKRKGASSSSCDPLVVVFIPTSSAHSSENHDDEAEPTAAVPEFMYMDQTERLRSTTDPDFETPIKITHHPGTDQLLKFSVYDCSGSSVSDEERIGSVLVRADDLFFHDDDDDDTDEEEEREHSPTSQMRRSLIAGVGNELLFNLLHEDAEKQFALESAGSTICVQYAASSLAPDEGMAPGWDEEQEVDADDDDNDDNNEEDGEGEDEEAEEERDPVKTLRPRTSAPFSNPFGNSVESKDNNDMNDVESEAHDGKTHDHSPPRRGVLKRTSDSQGLHRQAKSHDIRSTDDVVHAASIQTSDVRDGDDDPRHRIDAMLTDIAHERFSDEDEDEDENEEGDEEAATAHV